MTVNKIKENNQYVYLLKDIKLIWSENTSEPNNLYIENIWNMKNTSGYDDWCVDVSIISDDTFVFHTFSGIKFTMEVRNNKVKCIEKEITK